MYIDRNKDGKITGIFVPKQYEGQGQIADDDIEVIAFQDLKPSEAQLNEEKIQARIRELAIQSLKVSSDLPKNYK